MNIVTINDKQLEIKEYKGQRVVTFKDIDTVHERMDGTARKRFNDNRERFIENEDYFKITPSEFRTAFGNMDKRQQNDITLITETGYLMLVKSFTDNLAWDVQRTLVNAYFKTKSPQYLPTAAGNAAASLISALSKGMRDQGHTPERVAVQIELICRQFGIDIVDDYVKPNQHPQVYLFGND